jgi:hypothetical protein
MAFLYGRAERLTTKNSFRLEEVAAGAGRRTLWPAQVAQFVREGHLIMPLDDLGAEVIYAFRQFVLTKIRIHNFTARR